MSDATSEGRSDVPGVVWVALAGGTAVAVLVLLASTGEGLSLPALFMALAAVMLVLGLAAFWQSLRAVFGGGPEADAATGGVLPERTALLEEKQTLLRAIKDIAFEREVGKISEEDFARLDRAYRRRAKEVLKQLDQDLDPFIAQAERLVAVELGEAEAEARKKRGKRGKGRKKKPRAQACPACGTSNDLDAEHCKECGARLAPVECPSCGTENDPDAKFCKRCATSLGSDGAEARVGAAAGAEGSARDGAEADETSETSDAGDEGVDASDEGAADAESREAQAARADGGEEKK